MTLRGYVLGDTEPLVMIVKVDVPAALRLDGEKDAVTPLGSVEVPNTTAEFEIQSADRHVIDWIGYCHPFPSS